MAKRTYFVYDTQGGNLILLNRVEANSPKQALRKHLKIKPEDYQDMTDYFVAPESAGTNMRVKGSPDSFKIRKN